MATGHLREVVRRVCSKVLFLGVLRTVDVEQATGVRAVRFLFLPGSKPSLKSGWWPQVGVWTTNAYPAQWISTTGTNPIILHL